MGGIIPPARKREENKHDVYFAQSRCVSGYVRAKYITLLSRFCSGSHRSHRVPGPTLQRVRSICLSTITLLLPSKIAWDLSSTDNFFEFFGNLVLVFKYRVGFFGQNICFFGEEIERK